jgi:hypothetical protein
MMKWKGFGMKQLWLTEILSQNLPEGTEENHKTSQDSWCPGQDMNPALPEYKSRALLVDQLLKEEIFCVSV